MSGFDSHRHGKYGKDGNRQKEYGKIAKLSLGMKGKILYFYLTNLFTN